MQLALKLRVGAKFYVVLGVTTCMVDLHCGGTSNTCSTFAAMSSCLENRQIHVKASYTVHEHQKQRSVPKAEGAEKSGNWFLARRCRATGKAAGSAGVKYQGVFGGQIFPVWSAPLGKELVIKELEFLFLLPGMKIAGLLFNLLQFFGWG